MNNNYNRVLKMTFSSIYDSLLNKLKRKDRTKEELNEIIYWLLGYSIDEIHQLYNNSIDYYSVLVNAPEISKYRHNITGSICGVKIQNIEDDIIKTLRCLDKLVDECYKGKSLEKVLKAKEK